MSKARHLGNLLDTDGDVISSSLDNVDTSSFIEKINWQHNAGTVGTFNETASIGTINVGAVTGLNGSTMTATSNDLPAGLSLSAAGALTGTLPNITATATSTFNVSVTDGTNNGTREFTITNTADNDAPVWNTASGALTAGSTTAYSVQLSATEPEGGSLTYSLVSGSLPNGLSMNSSGLISGTPSADGTFNFTISVTDGTTPVSRSFSIAVTVSYPIAYLVIAGGGGGGHSASNAGGGGGAGGYRNSFSSEDSGGGGSTESGIGGGIGNVITITVGGGGATSSAGAVPGTAGIDSSISGTGIATVTSAGGGGGGTGYAAAGNPTVGGSGGGGWAVDANMNQGPGAAGTVNQGYAGGAGQAVGSYGRAGGGGGAGAVGADGNSGGNGGAGLTSSITASAVTRGGGGGGGTDTRGGGGGRGCGTGGSAVAGSVNTGGGAGGGGFQCGVGQAGGSGVVILRMLTSDYTGTTSGSPTVTTSGSDTILTFNGNGSYTA